MLVQGAFHLVGQVAVGEYGDEGDGLVRDFAYVEGLLPLADYEGVGRQEERGDVEVGYAEGAAWGTLAAEFVDWGVTGWCTGDETCGGDAYSLRNLDSVHDDLCSH